jgi:hypothetical protein
MVLHFFIQARRCSHPLHAMVVASLDDAFGPDALGECQCSSVVVVFLHDHGEWWIAWRGCRPGLPSLALAAYDLGVHLIGACVQQVHCPILQRP